MKKVKLNIKKLLKENKKIFMKVRQFFFSPIRKKNRNKIPCYVIQEVLF